MLLKNILPKKTKSERVVRNKDGPWTGSTDVTQRLVRNGTPAESTF